MVKINRKVGIVFIFLLIGTVFATAYFLGFINPNLSYSQTIAFPGLSFSRPVNLVEANDGPDEMFILEQKGFIKFFDKRSTETSANTFLDITDRVFYDWEGGLLGFALHPEFSKNGQFFVYYTAPDLSRNESDGCSPCLLSTLSRFTTVSGDLRKGDESSELILFQLPQSVRFHRAGQLLFGPDNMLYTNVGEAQQGGQNLTNFYGKTLRIDVDSEDPGLNYHIPEDNPFVGLTNETKGEIYAYGFRNHWRGSFDIPTGTFWVGDVGDKTYEEVDVVERGGNYGWRIMEGPICRPPASSCNQTGLISPTLSYPHVSTSSDINDPSGLAVIGGEVYRGSKMDKLVGKYIFADYSGSAYALTYDFNTKKVMDVEFLTRFPDTISSIEVDSDGEIYFVGHSIGVIYKLNTLIRAIGTFVLWFTLLVASIFLIVRGTSLILVKFTSKSISAKQQWLIILGIITVLLIFIGFTVFMRGLAYSRDAN